MSAELKTNAAIEGAALIQTLLIGKGINARPTATNPKGTAAPVKGNGNTNKQSEDPEKIKKAVTESVEFFEKFVKEFQFDLRFTVDDKSNSIIIQLFEKGSGKLIRQIPPDEILKLKQKISDLLGMIYDQKM